ncbi:MAG: superinfection immunity protein [Methyloceanibacter sp.]
MNEVVIVALALYFLPAIVAGLRGHHNSGAIFALNLLLGWTALGWIIALVWSFTAVQAPVKVRSRALVDLLPKKQPEVKPFLATGWDKPKPVAPSRSGDWALWGFLGFVLTVGIVAVVAYHQATLNRASQEGVMPTWYKPAPAPGIQYTGAVLEGLTAEQIKKLEAERDTIPMVQTVPLSPKK